MENSGHILPCNIKDSRGRLIILRAFEPVNLMGLMDMYDRFEPKGLEAGLPPANDETRHKWLGLMVSSFSNILATHKGIVIGHAALDRLDDQSCPEFLIFIQKEFRHCGIGTKISGLIKKIAKNAGCEKVFLNVRTGNAIAVRVFKKVGFKFIGEIDIQREMELTIKRQRRKPSK